jgi:uncharacterized protein YcbK (DUF882 family)
MKYPFRPPCSSPCPSPRRQFFHRALRHGAGLAGAATLAALAPRAWANVPQARALALAHTHTGERVELVYAVGERYLDGALGQLNRFLRDHYSGEVGRIDPGVFDQLHQVQRRLGGQAFEVISGYRGARTNAHLQATRGGGVATRSLHLEGRALDIRLQGVALADLRDAALELRAGGVGYYPGERFVHIDTGRVRRW